MLVQTLNRNAVRFTLNTARLPLSAAEALLSHQGDEEWPPTLAFEGFESTVKRIVGEFLRDETLIDEGRLGEAKVNRLRQAVDLEAVAEQRREEAEAGFEQRRDEDRRRREEAAEEARERKAAVARDEAAAKQKANAKARRKAEAVSQAEKATEKALDRKARRSRVVTLSAEEKALEKERAAVARSRTVDAVDKQLRASKAARTNGR